MDHRFVLMVAKQSLSKINLTTDLFNIVYKIKTNFINLNF